MDIGKRIKQLRTEKLMTQSELSGNVITRNMLSQIENGIATPSLPTVTYLAKRLGVPVGYLLSDDNEDFIYCKASAMVNIKKAFTDRNYEMCRDLCISVASGGDDEIELILAICTINIAVCKVLDGNLRSACDEIDSAIIHSRATIYDTVSIRNCAYVLARFLRSISPTLVCSEVNGEDERTYSPYTFENGFCKYIVALDGLDSLCFDLNDESESLYKMHVEAKRMIRDNKFEDACKLLRKLYTGDAVLSKMFMYLTSIDMEICCREIQDFRSAYEYSQNKTLLLESMLSEV